ncbi:MAG: DUF2802 domain-containing protein [Candidatus Thiodiazotropha sp. (ex Myrtea spinifera)]|nr:DUF2802 domain-containing protein [Candidatus Thiodiazotropha sp. (ex Myrtea spinifera)]MCU7830791.1 DUF2802 domain-containing protein [Candidatus Thiodiazotropha sp. (ex Myrtea sp. 'scaly one' KF741663)]
MPADTSLVWVVILFLVVMVTIQWIVYLRLESRRRETRAQQKRDIETLKQTVGALCSSAVGVDKRVNKLERHGRDLEERQEYYEQQNQAGDPPYTDAIRMVQDGAGPEQLIRELGISRDAADLIIMMHGIK